MKNALVWGLAFVVVVGLWAWYDLRTKPANDRIQAGVRQIIKEEPSLEPMYSDAMGDGVLTILEAKRIVDAANALKEHSEHESKPVAKTSTSSRPNEKKGESRPSGRQEPKPVRRSGNRKKSVGLEFSETVGGTGGRPFRAIDRDGRPMIGVLAKVGTRDQQPVLRLLKPLFTVDAPRDHSAVCVIAKDGYAVGGLQFYAGEFVHAVRPVFLRIDREQLNPDDSYLGQWIGSPDHGEKYELVSDGRFVLGVHGHRNANVRSAGIVYAVADQ